MSVNKEAVLEEVRAQLAVENWVKDVAKENEASDEYSPRSNRLLLWDCFADEVGRHVEEYTVPQYGDFPDDNVASWSADDCIKQIQKYVNRMDSNSRGELEATRDLLKIAHYASLVWCKRLGFEEALAEVRKEQEAQPEVKEEVQNG